MTLRAFAGRLFSAYCLVLFAILALIALTVNLFVPTLRARRWVAGTLSRAFFRLAGIPLRVEGLELLPQAPCVVVANHASYIDGIVAAAALPPDFAFVIKKEMVRVPLASLLLRRLGSAFVERFDRHKGGADTRRVWKLAARGQSLVFFPEGTFDSRRQVGRFLGGAFATAQALEHAGGGGRNSRHARRAAVRRHHGLPARHTLRDSRGARCGGGLGAQPSTHCRGGGRAAGAVSCRIAGRG